MDYKIPAGGTTMRTAALVIVLASMIAVILDVDYTLAVMAAHALSLDAAGGRVAP
jgi:hypothetical protein